MTEQDRAFAPAGPLAEDDLLAPKPSQEPEDEAAGGARDPGAEPAATDVEDEAERPQRSTRSLMRLGWALIVVVAVIGILGVIELARVSSAIDNTACVQKAQAQFMQTRGPGVSAGFAGLGRLAGLRQLRSCGQ